MPETTIRPFAWSDVPAITAIYAYYVNETAITFDTEAPNEPAMAEKFAHLVELGHPLMVAEQAGTVIGYAYASLYRPRLAYRFTCEDSIYLAPDSRGNGLGARLLTGLLAASSAAGFKQMIAVITADSTASIGLHARFGFRNVGLYDKVGYKFDRWHDVLHMQRAL